MEPKRIIQAMRDIKRKQVSSFYNEDEAKYIFDNKLMERTLWPAWCISITSKGFDYIQEHEVPADDDMDYDPDEDYGPYEHDYHADG
jgi:hypothetical protein